MTYKTLVLPGNGIKGIYTLGALECLGKHGYLDEIENYIAVSSGSIIASLLIMGLRPIEILARVLSKSIFKKVGRVSVSNIAGGSSVFNFDPIEHELEVIFKDYIGIVPTLAEFYEKTDRTFICLGYDATNHKTIYFSKDTYPDIPIITAIRASCAFPLLFEPVILNDNLIVDGGVGCNYPLNWAIANYPGSVLSIYIDAKIRPIDVTTTRLTTLKELLTLIATKPDLTEMEKCGKTATIFKIMLDKVNFFDFSLPDRSYIDQFDEGYHLCSLNFK
uniref:Patatin-like phospholipase n=1 Tax=Rhinella marina erythrocytic-like virus TaxID=2859906 RepID=A0A8F6YJ19_9VIRU|nr:patatin-like phospholipase [Rhinella marina erythrocytic-like virus]